MSEQKFHGLSNEELADVWFALGAAESSHPGRFVQLRDDAFAELGERLEVSTLAPFLDERFREYRHGGTGNQPEPAAAVPAAPSSEPVRDTYPA